MRSSLHVGKIEACVLVLCLCFGVSTAEAFQPAALTHALAQKQQRSFSERISALHVISPLRRKDATLDGGPLNATEPVLDNDDVPQALERTKRHYEWKEFLPKGGLIRRMRWLITGASPFTKESDEHMRGSLASLARMVILLREYERRFGVPTDGDLQVQRQVVSGITQNLYGSGCPTWILDTVMTRVHEGMTGKEGMELLILPNRCFVYYPESDNKQCAGTNLFKMSAGFDIYKLGAVEQVAVRLASFASNTKSTERFNAASFRMPRRQELDSIKRQEMRTTSKYLQDELPTQEAMASEILDLASSTYGLFFFLNNPKLQQATNETAEDDQFWEIDDSTRNIFTRLAAHEASTAMNAIQENKRQLYPQKVVNLLKIMSSAGACSMWFGGGFADMLAAASMAVTISYATTFRKLAFEEQILADVAASFAVGLCSGLLAIKWPHRFCFGAIALGSVMDYMQGFKVVYGVIEVMSRNKVTGTARLLEGILFTGLISYTMIFGLGFAFRIMFGPASALPHDYSSMLTSAHGISQKLFPLLLPLTATAWSALFRPSYGDLPLMAFHGMLAMSLSWAGAPLFLTAATVTFSAGIISRFTGRQALGNTLAGLYALVPGTYMMGALLSPNKAGFLESVLIKAIMIGLGGWTGTILCSPTILGKSSGLHGRAFGTVQPQKKHEALLHF
ncbi:pheromone-regulated membrane protein [Seminavis robusta]|uniref:Pheromone-regulated membrane protein n=1 Tax=Seminavis robusta TaxID=568900 RepID=A0A9N8H6W6_9STRA|nr:pheromone-regulated membrane protein [Seminavis robusta]|eukprot:Sro124_g059810.1 pheromone-regulated membrane protein (680) ;mRNA; r:16781-18915